MKRRGHFWIDGRVQGVFFRVDASEEASRLGLTGWVKNLPDGRVEIVAEGEEHLLERFLAWCRKGPPAAHVTDIEEDYTDATGEYPSFMVTY